MTLPELCIRRPVFATVLSLVIVLIGLVCFQRLSVREYPNIDPPVVTVDTTYPGASAQIIETQVTQVLEDALAGLEGVDFMKSISREQVSQISITFHLSRDPESAASDVRDRVARGRALLPEEVLEPVVQKAEADAQPIIFIALLSDHHDRLQLYDYADRNIKDRLQALPGVAFVRMFGSRYTMRLWLDPERLAAYGLTPQDVEDALRRQNVEVPAGRVESAAREFTVLSETDLRTAEDFNNLIIRESGGFLVRLSDVGRAQLGAGNERFATRYKGKDAIAMAIVKQSAANPLEVSKAVQAELRRVSPELPQGMFLDLAYDAGIFIKSSIDNVFETIAEAVALVVLIIFVFLRTLRATLIPLVTIPVSLIGACAVMVAFGFTINTLTLLAAVLAVGLVVDDAIVMLENVHRHIEEGQPPRQAALNGSREIGFAIIAMTLTLASVYAPVGFQPGTTGKLFTEFAWTLAGAVLVSGFVALTLSPMMCAVLLKPHGEERHGALYNRIESAIVGLTRGYRNALRWALDRRLIVLAVGVLVAAGGGALYSTLKHELSPTEDRGFIFGVFVAPEGSTLAYTDGYARRLEAMFAATPDIEKYFVVTGFPVVTNGAAFIRLKDWGERRPVFAVQKELQPKMFAGAPGVLAFPTLPPSLGASPFDRPVNVVVQTHLPFDELADVMARIVAKAQQIPGLINVETDLKLNKPQLRVDVNRDKAAAMGVDTVVIGRALETMFGGRQVTRFKRYGEQYDVLVQLPAVDRTNPRDLNRIYVRGADGQMVGLANVVSFTESVAPKELNHFNQLRAATITATLGGLSQGEALDAVERIAKTELPEAQIEFAGTSREYKKSQQGMVFILGLSLVFIYLVLAAQFESFVDPLIIMLTVPFAMAGAFFALWLGNFLNAKGWIQAVGMTWNIYSQVGIVTLIGLITKHGILIVEFANQRQRAGLGKLDAVVEAATLRLRPILMTTGAMVLGAIPLAIASGAGAESRGVIGWTIVGGLLVGTLFTLFIVPTVYVLIGRRHTADEDVGAPVAVK